MKLHFLRYEFKYILSYKLKKEIERELVFFMLLDPFVQNIEERKYIVRSLYFDDPFYSFFYEKIDGLMHRTKFRIRTYSQNPEKEVPLFLEKKGRYNNYVYKDRLHLDKELAIALRENKINIFYKLITEKSITENLFKQFEYDRHRKQIQPVMLIDYKRRPYISKYDYDFRLTLDSDLYGTMTSNLFPVNTVNKRKLLPGQTIMEIKFSKQIPSWFHRIIKTYELTRISISKYCLGMNQTDLVEDL